MNPIELPISARLDTSDALAKAQALTAEAEKTAKSYDKAARAAKRLADRMQAAAASTGGPSGGGPSSFGGGGGSGGGKATKITADGDFFDRLGKSLLRMRPASIAGNLMSGNMSGMGRMGFQSLLGEMGGVGGAAGLMGLLGVAGAGVGAAGLLAVNKAQADFTKQQMLLTSAVTGGPNLGNPFARGLQIRQAGADISVPGLQGYAQTLAQMGVSGRGGQLMGTLKNTAAFAGAHGMDPGSLMPLAGTLATQGGMDQSAMNRMFQDLGNVSKDSDVSVSQLLDSMKVLSKTASGAARDVLGLAAVQHMVGASSGINVGQAMSGVMSAQGGSALAASALLGLSPDALLKMQNSRGGTAKVFDRISGLVKQMDQGPAGTDVTEALLNQSGLLDTSQMGTGQAKALLDKMKNAPSGEAYKLYQQYSKDTSKPGVLKGEDESIKGWAHAIDRNTDALTKLGIWLDNATTKAINAQPGDPPNPGPPASAIYHVGNQQQLQYDTALGMKVGNTHGGAQSSAMVAQEAWKLANGDPRVFALMMAQMSQESGFKADAIQKGVPESKKGYGIAQFTATLGSAGLKKYLGSSDPTAWHQAALDPNKAMNGLAAYDRDLLSQANGSLKKAAAMYNGGPNTTSSSYGNSVGGVAQGIYGSLDITVTHKDSSGKPTHRERHTVPVKPPKGHVNHSHGGPRAS